MIQEGCGFLIGFADVSDWTVGEYFLDPVFERMLPMLKT